MSAYDEAMVERSAIELLVGIGEDPRREGLRGTPQRVARAWREITSGYHEDPAEILRAQFEPGTYDQMVAVRRIEFNSLCEHHLLPFHGVATVAYLPDKKVVGLSKMARLVHCYAKRLQIQERMTEEIALALQDHLEPLGVGVIVRAHHLCMQMRGAKTKGEMVTSHLTGPFRLPEVRAEFFALESD